MKHYVIIVQIVLHIIDLILLKLLDKQRFLIQVTDPKMVVKMPEWEKHVLFDKNQ